MRFAVHGPGYPVASPRSHGVPRRDIDRRVHVRVAGETAGSAPEDGLTLAQVPVHPPARRTPLARQSGLIFSTRPGALCSSRRTSRPQPDRRMPRFSPAFSRTFRAGVTPGAFREPGHVSDLQVFDADHVEAPRDIGGRLLGPVLAPVGLAGLAPGDRVPDPAAAVRSPRRAGQCALQAPRQFRSRIVKPGARSRSPVDSAALTATPPGRCPRPPGRGGAAGAAPGSPARPSARVPVGVLARRGPGSTRTGRGRSSPAAPLPWAGVGSSRYLDMRTHYRVPTDISGEVTRRFRPALKARVWSPRFS